MEEEEEEKGEEEDRRRKERCAVGRLSFHLMLCGATRVTRPADNVTYVNAHRRREKRT